MSTNQNVVRARHKSFKGFNLSSLSTANAQIIFRFYFPVSKETVLRKFSIFKRTSNTHFRDRDNGFAYPLIDKFIQGKEH